MVAARSEYKPAVSDKPSLRPKKARKKTSLGILDGKSKKLDKEVSQRQKRFEALSKRPMKKKPPGSDEVCVSSELPKQEDFEEKSTPEKSGMMTDGRLAWVQSVYQKRVKGIVKEFGNRLQNLDRQ